MSIPGDTFEPDVIQAILKDLKTSTSDKRKFKEDWEKSVKNRVEDWLKNRENQSKHADQLKWEAEVVEYVNYVYRATAVHGNAGATKAPPPLNAKIPLLGPRFLPPSYTHISKREVTPKITPTVSYIRPLTVVHPLYFSASGLAKCPQCGSTEVRWDSWTASGARDVHGVRREERALGYQLRCKDCRDKYGKGGTASNEKKNSCFATTNKVFWEQWEHWKIPRWIPYFMTRSAVTHELLDLIVEFRPSLTSAGLEEHIKQLHLLEYHERMLEYLTVFESRRVNPFASNPLEEFSAYGDLNGYNDESITNDMITDLYLEFSSRTRMKESAAYLKTRTGQVLSLDNTFKSAGKAVVIDKNKARTKLMKGGILSVINEKNEILAWRLCQSPSPAEIGEVLGEYATRCNILEIGPPDMVVVDNCCQVRKPIKAVLPTVGICLDVYHFLMRYLAVILNGNRNHHRGEVAQDIRNAILEQPSSGKDKPAKYWPKEEQEKRLTAAYDKWSSKGSVWSVAASKVHADQLAHVRKGCLARRRNDIASDGSRIEGSHKGWNSLQRAQPSGLEFYVALAHDFVLRRNLRVLNTGAAKAPASALDIFPLSAQGSHHLNLVQHSSGLFNRLLTKEKSSHGLQPRPLLKTVNSGEVFGLVPSRHTESFGGLLIVKNEPDESQDRLLEELDDRAESVGEQHVLAHLHIDQDALLIPEQPAKMSFEETASTGLIPDRKRKSMEPTAIILDEEITSERPNKRRFVDGPNQLDNITEPMIDCNMDPESPPAAGQPGLLSMATDAAVSQSRSGLFKFKTVALTSKPLTLPHPAVPSHQTSSGLTAALPLPDDSTLTRSQIVFKAGTSTHPLSLDIKSSEEFFLFMDMRADQQWTSFNMNAQKWASATKMYNTALQAQCSNRPSPFVRKHPRALMEKLGEIEMIISQRIAKSDYKCKNNSEAFWRKHCHAVSLVKTECISADGSSKSSSKRKSATCSRCQTIMYPGPSGSAENHKKGYCADGVRQRPKPESKEELPPWPQPPDIFINGTHFNPIAFLLQIRKLYDKVLGQEISEVEYSMEDEAFSRLLASRITEKSGMSLFQLYDLDIMDTQGMARDLILLLDGTRYLRVDCLQP